MIAGEETRDDPVVRSVVQVLRADPRVVLRTTSSAVGGSNGSIGSGVSHAATTVDLDKDAVTWDGPGDPGKPADWSMLKNSRCRSSGHHGRARDRRGQGRAGHRACGAAADPMLNNIKPFSSITKFSEYFPRKAPHDRAWA
ncbi:hypothetical protein MAPG_10046 [Magnaporthiopsis poae ATCC 64411]|uniref:Uncharacterized protein n=1 Tax=Magnaporthiopsis poae (strain ATCC 64411 / 73-15) TaxID=644358 RepID=A0A0C4EBJ6_MAGP6|nr:hypothetical protein MAPG_10046 [Magnaporthiopsis poae ATCC 64411]